MMGGVFGLLRVTLLYVAGRAFLFLFCLLQAAHAPAILVATSNAAPAPCLLPTVFLPS